MAGTSTDEEWLSTALRAARSSDATGRDLRRLQWQILELSRAGAGARPQSGGEELLLEFEELMAAASGCAGTRFTSAAQLQRHLKGAGHGELAKRVARLARGRHAAAHPDPALRGDVLQAMAPGSGDAGFPTEAGDTGCSSAGPGSGCGSRGPGSEPGGSDGGSGVAASTSGSEAGCLKVRFAALEAQVEAVCCRLSRVEAAAPAAPGQAAPAGPAVPAVPRGPVLFDLFSEAGDAEEGAPPVAPAAPPAPPIAAAGADAAAGATGGGAFEVESFTKDEDDPLAMLSGMGVEEVHKVTLFDTAKAQAEKDEEAGDTNDPLAMLSGMCEEEACKVTLIDTANAQVEAAAEREEVSGYMNDPLAMLSGMGEEEVYKVSLIVGEEAGDMDDPLAMLSGMGEKEVYKVTLPGAIGEKALEKLIALEAAAARGLAQRAPFADWQSIHETSTATGAVPECELQLATAQRQAPQQEAEVRECLPGRVEDETGEAVRSHGMHELPKDVCEKEKAEAVHTVEFEKLRALVKASPKPRKLAHELGFPEFGGVDWLSGEQHVELIIYGDACAGFSSRPRR